MNQYVSNQKFKSSEIRNLNNVLDKISVKSCGRLKKIVQNFSQNKFVITNVPIKNKFGWQYKRGLQRIDKQ